MLLSRVICLLLLVAVVFGACNGKMAEVSAAGLAGAADAVTLLLGIGGALCLWSGVMEVMQRSGLAAKVAWLLAPLIRLLFGKDAQDRAAAEALSQNMAANLLGLGSAATPAGLRAASRLHTLAQRDGRTPRNVYLLIVLNTASVQLIPTTVAAVRAQFGSATPYDILPAVWLSRVVSVVVGVLAAKSFGALGRRT